MADLVMLYNLHMLCIHVHCVCMHNNWSWTKDSSAPHSCWHIGILPFFRIVVTQHWHFLVWEKIWPPFLLSSNLELTRMCAHRYVLKIAWMVCAIHKQNSMENEVIPWCTDIVQLSKILCKDKLIALFSAYITDMMFLRMVKHLFYWQWGREILL